jgi:hypothetical protein
MDALHVAKDGYGDLLMAIIFMLVGLAILCASLGVQSMKIDQKIHVKLLSACG